MSISTPCATPVSSRTANGSQSNAAIAVRYQKCTRQKRTASRSTGFERRRARRARRSEAEAGDGDTATGASYGVGDDDEVGP